MNAELEELGNEYWTYFLGSMPLYASLLGYHDYDAELDDLSREARFESEALAFHESIPGHHLQLAIAQELEGIPAFRRHAFITVFHEGWGLYAERLSDEMSLYTGDLERFRILSFDSWRAGRLVVRAFHDTLLGSGSVPMPTMHRIVDEWVEAAG